MPEKKGSIDVKSIEKILKALGLDVDALLGQLKAPAKDFQKTANKVVAERPLLALGAAFVVGMVLGILLSKSKD